jgi:hypothetical protein
MVHVVDFEEGNDLCHVTKPPKVPGSRPKATLPATVQHKQSIGVGGHLNVRDLGLDREIMVAQPRLRPHETRRSNLCGSAGCRLAG